VSSKFIPLADCRDGLEHLAVPAWVLDAETVRFVWANELAVEMWQSPSVDELLARDVIGGAPEKVVARTRQMFERVRAGSILREEWAFYPRGVPTMVLLDLRGVLLSEGRLGVLNQALPLSESAPPSLQRVMAMTRHTAVMSALVRVDGTIIEQNAAALLTFGGSTSWTSWLRETEQAEQILRATLAGAVIEELLEVVTPRGPRWHRIRAQALRDPVTGELGTLVEHGDETARVDAEQLAEARGHVIDRLNRALVLVEQQRQEILELSAPMLDVGDRTLAVPIIGRLSDEQCNVIMTKLLDSVVSRGVRHVILDVTGVVAVDAGSAQLLHRLIRALRLLGCAPSITGVRPELALELIESGIDLDDIPTLRSLAAGLRLSKAPR
jgi:rsbT co-antagonist protein RsbR